MRWIKTVFILFLFVVSFSVFAQDMKQTSLAESNKQTTVEITINGDKYQFQDVNQNAKVDIYSILGLKVKSFEIKSGYSDSIITLPKGYYILKIDNTSRKIAVK